MQVFSQLFFNKIRIIRSRLKRRDFLHRDGEKTASRRKYFCDATEKVLWRPGLAEYEVGQVGVRLVAL